MTRHIVNASVQYACDAKSGRDASDRFCEAIAGIRGRHGVYVVTSFDAHKDREASALPATRQRDRVAVLERALIRARNELETLYVARSRLSDDEEAWAPVLAAIDQANSELRDLSPVGELIEHVLSAEPTEWSETNDLDGAAEWEQRAMELVRRIEGKR